MRFDIVRRSLGWFLSSAALLAGVCTSGEAAAQDCSAAKALACQWQLGTCLPAWFGGHEAYVHCVDVLSDHWCTPCCYADPRDSSLTKPLSSVPGQLGRGFDNVGMNEDGRLEVFAVDALGALAHTWQQTPAGAFSPFATFPVGGGSAVSKPAAIRRADGRIEVFAVRDDARVHRVSQLAPNVNWGPMTPLGNQTLAGGVAVNVSTDGRLLLAGVDFGGALVIFTESAPGSGTGNWASLGGNFVGTPVIGANLDGRLEIFAVGADTAIHHTWEVAAGAWVGYWGSLGGSLKGTPAVTRNADGRLELFATGQNDATWHIWQLPSGGWGNWASLGDQHKMDPAVGVNLDGTIEVFVVGMDDAVWRARQVAPNGGWGGFSSLGGVVTSSPEVGRDAVGALSVFATGLNHQLFTNWQTTPALDLWSGWAAIGGNLTPSLF